MHALRTERELNAPYTKIVSVTIYSSVHRYFLRAHKSSTLSVNIIRQTGRHHRVTIKYVVFARHSRSTAFPVKIVFLFSSANIVFRTIPRDRYIGIAAVYRCGYRFRLLISFTLCSAVRSAISRLYTYKRVRMYYNNIRTIHYFCT